MTNSLVKINEKGKDIVAQLDETFSVVEDQVVSVHDYRWIIQSITTSTGTLNKPNKKVNNYYLLNHKFSQSIMHQAHLF